MKRAIRYGLLVAALLAGVGLGSVFAFNPGAHMYIAEHVFPDVAEKVDLFYGSMAPDIALYVASGKWGAAFTDTHYTYIDLKPYAWGAQQKAFAKGWLTHNESWGADLYAHGPYPAYNGYINEKAGILLGQTGYDLEFMHFAVEVAVDLLLKSQDHDLGEKMLKAAVFRSPGDRDLLLRVLAWKYKRTDWVTLVSTELAFRSLVTRYATALALPAPLDRLALAGLGSQLANELFGMENITERQLLDLLNAAISLCAHDYLTPVEAAIQGIKQHLGQ
jgi:hypothetical protein